MLYAGGQGVTKNEVVAAQWYTQAANQGYSTAQFNLGLMYANGMGVAQNYDLAVDWYNKAASRGYAAAEFNLGMLYASGQGVPQELAKTVAWFRKAADQGYVAAQSNLGVMYAQGRGVPQSNVDAYMWFEVAATNHSTTDAGTRERAANTLATLSVLMAPSEIAEGQRLAKAYTTGETGAGGDGLNSAESATPSKVAVAPADRGEADKALVQRAEVAITDKMKDPDSVRFSAVRVVSGPRPHPSIDLDLRYSILADLPRRVCGYVNAKNSFGGYVGKEPFVGGWRGTEFVVVMAPAEEEYFAAKILFYLQPIAELCGDP